MLSLSTSCRMHNYPPATERDVRRLSRGHSWGALTLTWESTLGHSSMGGLQVIQGPQLLLDNATLPPLATLPTKGFEIETALMDPSTSRRHTLP